MFNNTNYIMYSLTSVSKYPKKLKVIEHLDSAELPYHKLLCLDKSKVDDFTLANAHFNG